MAESKGLNWVQVVAGAAAAVSSAVLLSTLGVGGTLIGAAVGSIVASIGTHTYSRGLDASRERALALRRLAEAREDLDRLATHPDEDAEASLEHADKALGRVEAGLESRRLSWKHVALVAAGLFVGVMVTITAFELITGRAVSTYTGGSEKDTPVTVPVKQKPKRQTPTPTPSVTPAPTPAGTPTPTPTPSPTSTEAPTPTPTPTGIATLQTPTLAPIESPRP